MLLGSCRGILESMDWRKSRVHREMLRVSNMAHRVIRPCLFELYFFLKYLSSPSVNKAAADIWQECSSFLRHRLNTGDQSPNQINLWTVTAFYSGNQNSADRSMNVVTIASCPKMWLKMDANVTLYLLVVFISNCLPKSSSYHLYEVIVCQCSVYSMFVLSSSAVHAALKSQFK